MTKLPGKTDDLVMLQDFEDSPNQPQISGDYETKPSKFMDVYNKRSTQPSQRTHQNEKTSIDTRPKAQTP